MLCIGAVSAAEDTISDDCNLNDASLSVDDGTVSDDQSVLSRDYLRIAKLILALANFVKETISMLRMGLPMGTDLKKSLLAI